MAGTSKALYDFNLDGGFENCMSFSAGELITLIEKREDGWWQGVTPNSQGWFPGNYVSMVEEEAPPPPPAQEDEPPPPPPPAEGGATVAAAAASTPTSYLTPAQRKERAKKRASKAFGLARALIDYVPNAYDDDAIGFKKNDEITVMEKNPTGQWKGKNQEGKIGYFPGRYIELHDDDEDDDEDDGGIPADGMASCVLSDFFVHPWFLMLRDVLPDFTDSEDIIVPAKVVIQQPKREEPPTPSVFFSSFFFSFFFFLFFLFPLLFFPISLLFSSFLFLFFVVFYFFFIF